MRENLEELNARGLAEIPVLLGGAALTRTYVERDLREVYEGRLFYGKDAFEGLHVMDRLGESRRSGEDDPATGAASPRSPRSPRGSRRSSRPPTSHRSTSPPAPPRSPPTTRSSCRRSSAPRWSRASPSTTSPATSTRRRCSATSGSSGREKGENDAAFKDRIRPTLREELAKAKADDLLVPQVVYGYFAANGDGDDLVIWTDETRTAELARFRFPRQRKRPVPLHRRLLPPGRLRRGRLRRLPHRHHGGRRSASGPPSCSPPTSTRSTCCSTASASRWPRPSPSTGTGASARSGASPTRTVPT